MRGAGIESIVNKDGQEFFGMIGSLDKDDKRAQHVRVIRHLVFTADRKIDAQKGDTFMVRGREETVHDVQHDALGWTKIVFVGDAV